MRQLFLAALGVFAVSGIASAQQPQYTRSPAPVYVPRPAAVAGVQPASGLGAAPAQAVRGKFMMVTGAGCPLGQPCQNGCGSVKSDLAFYFGSCKDFFAPCGPTWSGGGLKGRCGVVPFAAPFGEAWCCPRQYDSYANH